VRLAVVAAFGAAIPALAALGLGAAGTLHVQLGGRAAQSASPPAAGPSAHLLVPAGAHGIAAVVDGRLWLATRRGLRIEGLPVSAAALSPHALYVAVGIGNSLVAMAPNRRLAWSHAAGGPVAAAAWSPDGLRIAYVVRRGYRYELRTIEGDGDHDRLVDRSVRPLRPSWRADTLALAYVGGGGRTVVYDLSRRTLRVVRPGACAGPGPVRAVAYAPAGGRLAVVSDGAVLSVSAGRTRCAGAAWAAHVAWAGSRIVVGRGSAGFLRRYTARLGAAGSAEMPGRVVALASTAGSVVGGLATPRGLRLASLDGTEPTRTLLSLPGAAAGVTALDVR